MYIPMGIFSPVSRLDSTSPLRYDEFSGETFRDSKPRIFSSCHARMDHRGRSVDVRV